MKNYNIRSLQRLMKASLLISSLGLSVAWAEPQLKDVNVNPLAAGKVELEFVFSEPVTRYSDKLQYRPNQLVVEVQDASSVLKLNPVAVDRDGVGDVKAERIPQGLRLSVEMNKLMPYSVSQQGERLYVRFGDGSSKPAPAAVAAASSNQTSAAPVQVKQEVPPGYINSVKGFDFRRTDGGNGKLMVALANSNIAADLRRRDNKLIVEFQNTAIPSDLVYIMDVIDFTTPVKSVETFEDGEKTRVELTISEDFEYRYDQMDKIFTVEVKKKEVKQEQKVYDGKLVTFNFQDISVRTVLQILADVNSVNLVTTDSVQGNITLRLDSVPWEQALDIVLKVKGLGKRMDGNVLMVAPAAELAEKERAQLETEKEVAELAPLYSEFIQLNYAKATDVADLLVAGETRLVTPRGSVSVDERTNVLLVKDTAESLDNIRRMMQVLDIPVKQVMIESRIVTVTEGVDEELGIRWGFTGARASDGGNVNYGTSGNINGANSANGGVKPPAGESLNVNLPVANPAGSIAFQIASLANGAVLDLELSALENEGKGEVIASPRITTANQKPAYIEQGTEIPYVESASSGATSVSFKKAVLSLRVTPQITPDDRIILDLVITQDTVGKEVPTATGTAVAIDKQEIGTQVLVDNGETIVLGGIFQQKLKNTVQKVPVLGDVPGVGALFRYKKSENSKSELLIFVTPKIVVEAPRY